MQQEIAMRPIRQHELPTPWYRNFWAWLVFTIPFLTVVAGITTIFIASDSRDSLVSDDYYREGLAINQQAERTQLARLHQISAALDLRVQGEDMRIVLHSKLHQPPTELVLNFFHSTLQEHDLALRFRRRGDSNQYHSPTRPLPDGRWHLTLQPTDASWRIQGILQLPADRLTAVRLAP